MASIVMHYDILHDMKRDIASRRPLLFMNPCDILRQKIMPESSYNHVVGMGPKLSGINLFRCINIIRGRRRTITYSTIKMLGSHITIGSPAFLSNMYLKTSAHPVCADMIRHQRVPARMKGAIVTLCYNKYPQHYMCIFFQLT